MSTFGDNLNCKNLTCDTINGQTPSSAGVIADLQSVLQVGNKTSETIIFQGTYNSTDKVINLSDSITENSTEILSYTTCANNAESIPPGNAVKLAADGRISCEKVITGNYDNSSELTQNGVYSAGSMACEKNVYCGDTVQAKKFESNDGIFIGKQYDAK